MNLCLHSLIPEMLYCWSGGGFYYGEYSDTILQLDPASQEWSQVGALQVGRREHAMSVVSVADIQDYCH